MKTAYKVMNRDAALERMAGDVSLLSEIARLFLAEYPDLMDRVANAIAKGSAGELETAAHTLKGSVANFAAGEATTAAFDLELIGRSGDLSQAGAGFERLTAAFAELRPELEELAQS